jgi:hypothetical protein
MLVIVVEASRGLCATKAARMLNGTRSMLEDKSDDENKKGMICAGAGCGGGGCCCCCCRLLLTNDALDCPGRLLAASAPL